MDTGDRSGDNRTAAADERSMPDALDRSPEVSGGTREHGQGDFEHEDVQPLPVIGFGVGLLILVGIASLALLGLMGLMGRRLSSIRETTGTVSYSEQPMQAVQPPTRSQVTQLTRAQRENLTGYAPVDRARGVFRIPIERAMEALVREGLPVRRQGPQAPPPAPGAGREPTGTAPRGPGATPPGAVR